MIFGEDSFDLENFKKKLLKLFDEYNKGSTLSNSTSRTFYGNDAASSNSSNEVILKVTLLSFIHLINFIFFNY